jgi:hypothetical protein
MRRVLKAMDEEPRHLPGFMHFEIQLTKGGGIMHHSIKSFQAGVLLAVGFGVLLTGCASTSPRASFKEALPRELHIDANDTAGVRVEAADGIVVEEHEKQRLARVIQQKIDMQKLRNANAADKREFELAVLMTRYDKGNAFARALLAGIGRIHVDASVTVLALPQRRKVAEFDIDKTFAWGGIYGAVTRVEDVEEGFAEGVAEAVTHAPKK